MKLAVAGAASLALGLWRAPPLRAQDREGCFTGCLKTYREDLNKRLDSCERVFAPTVLYKKGAWEKIKFLGMFPPRVTWSLAGLSLLGWCSIKAEWEFDNWLRDKCYPACECKPPSRSAQSGSSARQACEVPPPPKPDKPEIPPAPTATADPCWSCIRVNGNCCAPLTTVDDVVVPCACTGVPCKEAGCG